MSNHSGSYMLRNILELRDENKVFEMVGKDNTFWMNDFQSRRDD
ncbi:hypothetical protein [Desulfonema magnum]|uniref:Uncharacterized protein n=1 Tax=Desulfonema magnum TaxID=45655 RepID=A0A975BN65_9BACT|nr:hypothetical protein [Desulfonema magnum]QTA88263.1 Uncharacterized protein dnm_043050 [Desulfonema magnum]